MHLYNTLNQTDKGRRWAALNGTIGTGVAGQSTNAFSDTAATVSIFNSSGGDAPGTAPTAPPGRIVVPDYVKLIVTAIGTGNGRLAVTIDNIGRGLTADAGIQKGNADTDSLATATAIAKVQLGALAPTAASAKVSRIAIDYLKGAAFAVGDEIFISFAEPTTGLGALATRMHVPVGLTSIGPGGLLLVHVYNMTAAPSFELEMGWWELS